jgi:hypothetical protein
VVGGPNETVDPLPDDAAGGRFLYPSGFLEINLFASAFRRTSGDSIVLNQTGTQTFCSKGGGSITLNATIGNNGNVPQFRNERWWVSTSNNDHDNSSGFQIFEQDDMFFDAEKTTQSTVTFKMPALPAGTYFLYHGADVLGTESRKDDNVVRVAMKTQVIDC